MKLSRVRRHRSPARLARAVHAACAPAFLGHLYPDDYPGGVMAEALEDRRLLAADIAVSQDVPVPSADTGTTVSYVLHIANIGNQSATNVHLRDTVPTNTTFVTYSENPADQPADVTLPLPGGKGVVDFNLGTLAPQATATFTVVVRVDAVAPDGSTFNNTIVGTSNSVEDPPQNNTSTSRDTSVNSQADLVVTATAPQTVVAGTDIAYTVTVTNNGPTAAGNLVFTALTPSFTTFSSFTELSGPPVALVTPKTGQTGTIIGTAELFPSGATATFSAIMHVIPSADPDNMDTVVGSFTAVSVGVDRSPTNNINVSKTTPVIRQADIAVTSFTDQTLGKYESNWVYYIFTITNNGPSDAKTPTFSWNADPKAAIDQNRPAMPSLLDQTVVGPYLTQTAGVMFNITDPTFSSRGPVVGNADVLPAGQSAQFRVRVLIPIFGTYRSTITGSSATAEPPGKTQNNTGGDQAFFPDAPLTLEDTAPISAVVNRPIQDVFLMSYDDLKIGHIIIDQSNVRHLFSPAIIPDHRFIGQGKTTIDWGDGTPLDTPTLDVQTGGDTTTEFIKTFSAFGSHTYTRGGLYKITIDVTSDGGAHLVTTTQAVVSGLRPLIPTPAVNSTAITNVFSTIPLGTFVDPTPLPNSIYTAVINSVTDVNGNPIDPANLSSVGTVINNPDGTHTVLGTIKFPADTTPGNLYHVTVTVKASSDGGQDATFGVDVASVTPPVVGTPVNVAATPGVDTGPVPVATFTDPAGPRPLTSYSATIDWGDGSAPDAGTITLNTSTGRYTVAGNHTYSASGTNTIVTTITTANGLNGVNTTVISKATVGTVTPPPPTNTVTVTGATITGTAGTALSGVTVANLTETDTSLTAAAYTATIDWGDGTATSAGTIASTGTGKFSVKGTHTYAAAGTFTPKVTVTQTSNGNTFNGSGSAAISAAGTVLKPSGTSLTASVNTSFTNKTVGSFTDAKGNTNPANYTATINWGDGTATSAGKITYNSSTKKFTVAGSHKYTKKSPSTGFKVVIALKATGGASKGATATINSTAFVGVTPTIVTPSLKPTGISFTAALNQTLTKTIGYFTDTSGNTATGNYTVSINWGDGTSAGAGKLVYDATNKRFVVSGTHKYAKKSPSGGFAVKIAVKAVSGPSNGASTTVSSTATVA